MPGDNASLRYGRRGGGWLPPEAPTAATASAKGLALIEDIATPPGGPILVECPACLTVADRVLAYGPPAQRGARADAHEHHLLPCGHRVAGPLLFDLRGRPNRR